MDRHLTVVLFVVVLLIVGVIPGTVTNGGAQMERSDSMSHSVTSFMQVSAVEADSTVNREMWEEAFENANTESEKERLLEQRSKQLSEDLSAVRTKQKQLENGNASEAYADAFTAHVTELRRSIKNVSQTANESNVSSKTLSKLRNEACSVSIPNRSDTVVDSNATTLHCSGQSSDNGANNTTETPTNNTTETPTNNTTETPTDNTTETPTNNTTETPTDNTTETPTNNTTETPTDNTTEIPTDNTTEKSTNNSTATETEPTTVSNQSLTYPLLMASQSSSRLVTDSSIVRSIQDRDHVESQNETT